MPKLTVNNITLHYNIVGNISSPAATIVLVGGLSRDHRIWHKILPLLDPSLRVVLFNNRGTGQTSKPDEPYTIDLFADDLVAGLDVLNLGKVTLLGHSMGSYIAAFMAAKRADLFSSVILMTCSVKPSIEVNTYLENRIALVRRKLAAAQNTSSVTIADKDDILAAMPSLYAPDFLVEENIQEILAWETSNPRPQPAHAFIRHAEACINYSGAHMMPKITIPTTIIYGECDKMYTKSTAETIANTIHEVQSNIIEVAGSGHMIQIEKPAELAEIVHKIVLSKIL